MLKVKSSDICVRPLNPEKDLNFVLSSWLQSYRKSEFAHSIPDQIYYPRHQMIIAQILKHPSNSITILADPETPDQILGYIVYNTKEPIVFFTYIKHAFRGYGLGQYLFEGVKQHHREQLSLDEFATVCTHKGKRWAKLSKRLNLVFNPYIIGD